MKESKRYRLWTTLISLCGFRPTEAPTQRTFRKSVFNVCQHCRLERPPAGTRSSQDYARTRTQESYQRAQRRKPNCPNCSLANDPVLATNLPISRRHIRANGTLDIQVAACNRDPTSAYQAAHRDGHLFSSLECNNQWTIVQTEQGGENDKRSDPDELMPFCFLLVTAPKL